MRNFIINLKDCHKVYFQSSFDHHHNFRQAWKHLNFFLFNRLIGFHGFCRLRAQIYFAKLRQSLSVTALRLKHNSLNNY